MSPGRNIYDEHVSTIQFQQGYKEGFEAGKRALRREIKALLATLNGKEPYTTSTTTFTSEG